MTTFTQKPYLNVGCGRITLPGLQPGHHGLVESAIYSYPLWVNADRNAGPGVDQVFDAFKYPWPWPDNSFDGALLAHIVEHIPHEIRLDIVDKVPLWMVHLELLARANQLAKMQDGWYAFMSELHRVLTPGAIAHVLAPYAWSAGAMTDPSHTRYITEHVFTHQMTPDDDGPFEYERGALHLALVEPARFRITEPFAHLRDNIPELQLALATRINVAYELYVKLRAVK